MVNKVVASNVPSGESEGNYTFDIDSLASVPVYDASGNITTMTYGPDAHGRSLRITSTWTNGVWQGDSAPVYL